MEQLATLRIAVIEHVVIRQLAEKLFVEIEARRQVIVIIERDVQQRYASFLGAAYFGEDVFAGKCDVVHTRAAITRQRMGDSRIAILGNIQRQAHGAATAAQSTALDQTVRVGQDHFVVSFEVQNAFVEQHPAVQAVGRQRHGHVVDTLQPALGDCLRIDDKITVVDRFSRRRVIHQIDQAAVGCADRRDLPFIRADQPAIRLALEGTRTFQRLMTVVDAQGGGAQ